MKIFLRLLPCGQHFIVDRQGVARAPLNQGPRRRRIDERGRTVVCSSNLNTADIAHAGVTRPSASDFTTMSATERAFAAAECFDVDLVILVSYLWRLGFFQNARRACRF